MELHLVVLEPEGYLAHLAWLVVVEVLARRKYFDLADSGTQNLIQNLRRQALADIYESIEELKYYREHLLRI